MRISDWSSDVCSSDLHDVRFGDLRHSIEVEAVDGFTRQQPRLTQMTLDTASIPLGYFMLGQRRKEAGGRPAFLVRAFGNGRPALLDRGQAKIIEDERGPRGVVGLVTG